VKTLGVGIIGYGFMGRMRNYCYKTIPLLYENVPLRTQIVGVSTAHIDTAQAAAAETGAAFATDDWRRLIDRDDIHVIDICTPNAAHKEQVIAALNAGKHIYCDKPLTVNYADAVEIIDTARNTPSSIHQMTFQTRFFPATIRARQLIDEGAIGDVYHFHAAYLHAGYTSPKRPYSWRMDKAHGGGALVDLGSHIIDLMRHLLGEYESVFATTRTFTTQRPDARDLNKMHKVEVDDYALLNVKMAGGTTGVVEASRFATGVNDELRFEIHGSRGALAFNLMQPDWLYFYDDTAPGGNYGGRKGYTQIECVNRKPNMRLKTPKNSIGWRDGHVHCLFNLLSCIAENRPASPSLFDGAAVQRVMDAAYRSAETGGWVQTADVK